MLLATLLLACAATKADSADPCLPGDEPTLAIGTGEYAYEPLPDDRRLELIHGPQGGYHVIISLEATFIDASSTTEAELSGTIDGVELAHTLPFLTFRCDRVNGAQYAWGSLLIWDAQPEDLHGREATVNATVRDAAGAEVSAESTIVIWDPALGG